MALPGNIAYRDITAKIAEVDRELNLFSTRQGAFVRDLNNMITYFVYTLTPANVARAVEEATQAGEIDPTRGREIYDKLIQIQNALKRANSDTDKIAIIQNLRKWAPILRRLPDGDGGYNGLPGNPGSAPRGYTGTPSAPSSGSTDSGSSSGFGELLSSFGFGSEPSAPSTSPSTASATGPSPAFNFSNPTLPPPGQGFRAGIGGLNAPTTPLLNTISSEDMKRIDTIAQMADAGSNPTVTTTGGRSGTVSQVYRDAANKPIAFQVNFQNGPGNPTVSQRINLPTQKPTSGGWRPKTPRRKNRNSKKMGGYKSRKSRRRTFR